MIVLKYLGTIFLYTLFSFSFLMMISYKEEQFEKNDMENRIYYRKYLIQMIAVSLIFMGIIHYFFSYSLATNIFFKILFFIIFIIFIVLGSVVFIFSINYTDYHEMIELEDREEKNDEIFESLKKNKGKNEDKEKEKEKDKDIK